MLNVDSTLNVQRPTGQGRGKSKPSMGPRANREDATPSGLVHFWPFTQGSAWAAQPWALGRNPVGILAQENASKLQRAPEANYPPGGLGDKALVNSLFELASLPGWFYKRRSGTQYYNHYAK